jgi:predicted nucleotidyltransferase
MCAAALDLNRLASVCRRRAVDLLVAFGSVVRGLRRPDSDLDLAVWMTPANTKPQTLVELEVTSDPIRGRGSVVLPPVAQHRMPSGDGVG